MDHHQAYGEVPTRAMVRDRLPGCTLLKIDDSIEPLLDAFEEYHRKSQIAQTVGQAVRALNDEDHDKALSILEQSLPNLRLSSLQPDQEEVQKQVQRIIATDAARALVTRRSDQASFEIPPTHASLAEEWALPQQQVRYLVDELHPAGANTLLAAEFKAGKTTAALNLVRSLVDRTKFLDYFPTHCDGRVGYWNVELPPGMFTNWTKAMDIQHPGRVSVAHLRDFHVPVLTTVGRDWAINWLRDNDIKVWVIDPFATLFTGDENSNAEVREWLKNLDVIKRQAGVEDLVLVSHTGRNQTVGREHVRGASYLDGWADVRWIYSKSGKADELRVLRAHGRDVDLGEGVEITYTKDSHSLVCQDFNYAG